MALSMQRLVSAVIPAYGCPEGTKMHILNLGTLSVDEGWLLMGANGGSASNPNPVNKRRDLMLIAGLIYHPDMGLTLFECGSTEDVQKQWSSEATELFPRTCYNENHHLPQAISNAGYDIKDIKAVIMGHLHLDHAGGLEHFRDTGVPVYVHEEEFKHACWAAGTNSDGGLYLADYLALDGTINWQTFNDSQLDLCTGITLYHCPGHTPGLYYRSWVDSGKFIRRLQKAFSAKLIFGHDTATAEELINNQKYYE
ncbi:uncharacterized protein ASPGLDRAFT_77819 [Aspergillus glaucus CBS 516.65]|uniref:Metallo-beta-lactamase domain-containing protein n=1 Tax=Aspergillus glaucus CBS 516.65 TaxID=1160497 RepID=A0A1L9V5B6_ASPGL|nr:hypothetical protein ASPGLDRAFT_77819 [Aspergillus glaucus CBS 516.65]OJJ79108.1 hypothetical protein ASPGLDRAFT_77819 [Aspergillus glaucus CBS 516.65]